MSRGSLLIAAAALLTASACTPPQTDIVATTTEDVGDYRLIQTVEGRRLLGRVCVANPTHADEIARRIVQQVASMHYEQVQLELYAQSAPLRLYVWTPNGEREGSIENSRNACAEPAGD